MKPLRAKLSIGAGRPSGSWLMLLLLLAVLVPSVCLLWFMNQAVHNERLAVRQKLVDAYRVNLVAGAEPVGGLLAPGSAPRWTAEADHLSPPALFAKQVRAGLADARDLLRLRRQRHLSGPGPAPRPEAPEAAWTEAEGWKSSKPGGSRRRLRPPGRRKRPTPTWPRAPCRRRRAA